MAFTYGERILEKNIDTQSVKFAYIQAKIQT